MRMTTKTVWIAFDETEFSTEKECAEYEEKQGYMKQAKNALKGLTKFCALIPNCDKCPIQEICNSLESELGAFSYFEDLLGRKR